MNKQKIADLLYAPNDAPRIVERTNTPSAIVMRLHAARDRLSKRERRTIDSIVRKGWEIEGPSLTEKQVKWLRSIDGRIRVETGAPSKSKARRAEMRDKLARIRADGLTRWERGFIQRLRTDSEHGGFDPSPKQCAIVRSVFSKQRLSLSRIDHGPSEATDDAFDLFEDDQEAGHAA